MIMKKLNLRIIFVCVILAGLVSIIWSCGGDGDDDDDPISSIYGTYALESFNVIYSNGFVLAPGNVDEFSGTMYIYPSNFIYQIICMRIGQDGGCVEADATLAGDHFVDQISNCHFNLPYSFDGSKLTTRFPMWTCGANFTETDVWRKVSDATPASVTEENHDDYKHGIGAIIGELNTPSQ